MKRSQAIRIVAAGVGAFYGLLGLWAFVAPRSFYERIASFPPYNQHLLHDIGAFQAGVGAALLFALVRPDALLVALTGASVAGVLHFFSHVVDRAQGGRVTDPLSIGLIAAVVVIAALARSRPGEPVETPGGESPPQPRSSDEPSVDER